MDIMDFFTGETYSVPDYPVSGDASTPVANNFPMEGGQTNPSYAPPIGTQATDEYGAPIYSEINSTNYTYDAGGSAISIPAFKAAQAVTDAAIAGSAIDKSWLQKMADAGMDTNTVRTLGGALYKLVAQPNGSYVAQATNQQAVAAQQAAKTKQMFLYGALAIAAYLGLS